MYHSPPEMYDLRIHAVPARRGKAVHLSQKAHSLIVMEKKPVRRLTLILAVPSCSSVAWRRTFAISHCLYEGTPAVQPLGQVCCKILGPQVGPVTNLGIFFSYYI